MTLTAEKVISLAKLRSKIKDMQKEEKELTESLKKEMKRKHLDEYAPAESPYKIIKNEFKKSNVSWHLEWKIVAKKLFGKKYKSKEKELIEESKDPQTSITIEPNERYKK